MQHGISVYAGLDHTVEENLALIESAAAMGFKYLFTSAQIPETADSEKYFDDFEDVLTTAITHDLEIILDVNADNFSHYDFDGLTLRLDDGFSAEQVADISRARKIQINASTVTEEFLNSLDEFKANFDNIGALHNFYPHPSTGLDTYYFANQNRNRW